MKELLTAGWEGSSRKSASLDEKWGGRERVEEGKRERERERERDNRASLYGDYKST